MPWPDFIIIGFPKCGTTSLHENLSKHPNIYMARRDPKQYGNPYEIHFFDNQIDYPSATWYKGLFRPGYRNGEKTVNYVFDRSAIQNIKDTLPNAKIIICLREPVEFLYSWYTMHKKIAHSDNNHSINRDPKKRSEMQSMEFEEYFQKRRRYGNFYQYLKPVFDMFPRQHIYICFQDQLYQDTNQELNKIVSFLGLPKFQFRDIFRYQNDHTDLSKYSGFRKYFAEDNKKLSELLGINLDHWD